MFRILLIFAFGLFSLMGSVTAASSENGDVYSAIMRGKQVRVGISKDYPPLNFNAGARGAEIEMIRHLGEFLGVRVELVPLEVGEYAAAIRKRRVDMVIAGFSRNLERGRLIWFSKPYITVTPGVLADSRSIPQTRFGDQFEQAPISTIWDLKRLSDFRFAVKKGSTYQRILESAFPDMPRVLVGSNEEGLELLQKGSVDGFVHDSLYLEYLFSNSAKLRSSYVLLKGGSRTENLCVGLPFGDSILKNQIDLFIDEIIRLGLMDEWLKKYSAENR